MMKYENQLGDIEEKIRQDCYNRGYEQGRKNPCKQIVEYIEGLQKQVKEYQDKIEQGTLIELPDLTPKFAIVEYCWQKKKPLKVLEYYPCSYEFSTKRIVNCWLCGNMNFRVVIKGFDTREEAEKRLLELKGDK